ncbi:MAG: hypothetical protein M3304_00115, partial [Actinomycetota bacterium]|nr:hypothetical protein [Actinomycetota bacterium]
FVVPALYLRFAAVGPGPAREEELVGAWVDGEPEPAVAAGRPVGERGAALTARGGSSPRPGDAGEPLPSHYRQVEAEETPERDAAADREGQARASQIVDPKRGENEPGARKPPV